MDQKDVRVGCYYFPNYHVDPRNEKIHGPGWTEWQLVRHATPRFPNHQQPKVPLWGYEDESKPEVMEKKIDAAVDHGIDHFIFDWYHYEDGPYLERCLEQGFLKARNVDRIDFALMWANHDWVNVHPMSRAFGKELLYPGKVSPKVFRFITDLIVDRYFSHPSYLKVEGCPYFSIYDLGQFVAIHGSVEATRKAIDAFRERVRSAGFPDLHFNAVVWGKPVLPGEKVIRDLPQLITALGFDSVTSYVWIHHVELDETPFTPFQKVLKKYLQVWDRMEEQYNIPYFPNITMGWDNSPRTLQSDIWGPLPESTFSNCIGGNTPEAFQEALEIYRKRLSQRDGPTLFSINAWNEWTEGSYIEPDQMTGMGYLEAIAKVFGASANTSRQIKIKQATSKAKVL
ncbi:MAG: glycoside hydrolase family 99-like domain-containing protein [Deltaproteobacteria bacterium]